MIQQLLCILSAQRLQCSEVKEGRCKYFRVFFVKQNVIQSRQVDKVCNHSILKACNWILCYMISEK